MSSLRVPVSPRIRAVESVGASCSTFPSAASRAGLWPMICSNLRESRSWSLARIVADAATEDLLAGHSHLRYLVLQSRSNTIQQCFVVKWFGQKLYRACSQRLHPHSLVAMCRDEDDRNPATFGVQLGLQLQTGHPRHTNVRDQTCRVVLLARPQEFLRRRKTVCCQINRFQQVLDG